MLLPLWSRYKFHVLIVFLCRVATKGSRSCFQIRFTWLVSPLWWLQLSWWEQHATNIKPFTTMVYFFLKCIQKQKGLHHNVCILCWVNVVKSIVHESYFSCMQCEIFNSFLLQQQKKVSLLILHFRDRKKRVTHRYFSTAWHKFGFLDSLSNVNHWIFSSVCAAAALTCYFKPLLLSANPTKISNRATSVRLFCSTFWLP